MNFVVHELIQLSSVINKSKEKRGHSMLDRRKGAAMLGLCTFGHVGVTQMTTSRRIRATVNENDEHLCYTYLSNIRV